MCFLANAGKTGGLSPGRRLGPLVSGPVRGGEAGLDPGCPTDDATDGVGVGVGVGSGVPLVQAVNTAAIAAIAHNRARTRTSSCRHLAARHEVTAAVDIEAQPARSARALA